MAKITEVKDPDTAQIFLRCHYRNCQQRVRRIIRIAPSDEMFLLCFQHANLAKCNLSEFLGRIAGWPRETAKLRRRDRRRAEKASVE